MRLSFVRYVLVLYLGLLSVLFIDRNPFYTLPLVLLLIGFVFDLRWVGALGLLGYAVFTLGRLPDTALTDVRLLIAIAVAVILPMIATLELVITPRPYRLESISIFPLLIAVGLGAGALMLVLVLPRIEGFGIYLNSDPLVRVFLVISISILLFSPPLLTGGGGGDSRN